MLLSEVNTYMTCTYSCTHSYRLQTTCLHPMNRVWWNVDAPFSAGGIGVGMSGEGMAYAYAPGPGYGWAAMHPANPTSELNIVA